MVAHPGRPAWDWEPWEARRAKAPPGLPLEVREARADARLVIFVARARLRAGDFPCDLVERLAAVAQDERVQSRRRLAAAEVLAQMRAEAVQQVAGLSPKDGPGDAPRRAPDAPAT